MDDGTKNWWMFPKWCDEYERGVDEYVKKAFATKSQGNQNCCPCEVAKKVVQDHGIQRKQQEQQVRSKNKGKKRAFCSPGSMSAYLEFRKRQKENNEVLEESNRSLHNSITARIQNDDDALNENNEIGALNQNDNDDDDDDDDSDGLNENADFIETDYEGDQELEREVVAQYGMEETELSFKRKKHRGPTMLPKVHARTREERQVIVLNSLGQPVGPTEEIVTEFKFFGNRGKGS